MKYLLDTHTWIWSLNRPEKLGRRARRIFSSPSSQIHLSPVSVWEASHLHRRNRLPTRLEFGDWLKRSLSSAPLIEAAISLEIALQAAQIQLPQPDFGDSFLAATAQVMDLTLVTADEQLLACNWLKTLPAD